MKKDGLEKRDVLDKLREQYDVVLVCLGEMSGEDWAEAGVDAPLYFLESLDAVKVNGVVVYAGSLSSLIEGVSKKGVHDGKAFLDGLLSGAVLEYTKDGKEAYRCGVAVMPSCAGQYLSVVNKKDIQV